MNRTGLLLWIAGCSALAAWEFTSALADRALSVWTLACALVLASGAALVVLVSRQSNAAKSAYIAWTASVLVAMLAGQLSTDRFVPWPVWIAGVVILVVLWVKTKDLITNYAAGADRSPQ